MTALQLPLSYLLWHYTLAWGDLLRLYQNFSWFLWNFFSIRILSVTLFSPWRRIQEASSKSSGGFLGRFIISTLLRFIGLFVRLFSILSGLASLCVLSVGFLIFLVMWPLLPIVIVAFIAQGSIGILTFFS
ncbi:MAG: hypothetical protein Q7R93_01300 [bacterium]|nr:hypothetical protein [bacterium]